VWLSDSNKWLVKAPNQEIVLGDLTDRGIAKLDPWFAKHEYPAYYTSAIRTREMQIELIRQKALRAELILPWISDLATADMEEVVGSEGDKHPLWHFVWSSLLAPPISQMINPPEPDRAEYDYVHADGRLIKAGHLVGVSEHQLGKAFDIGGGQNLDGVIVIVQEAILSGTIQEIRACLKESQGMQNCCHVSCT
jgi:hypothetical protein